MRHSAAAASTLLMWSAPAHAQQVAAMVDEVLATNPTIGSARAELRAAEAGVDLARADARPQLEVSVQLLGQAVSHGTLATRGPDIVTGGSVSLPVWTGGRTRRAIAAARARAEVARANLEQIANMQLAQAATSGGEVRLGRELVAINARQVDIIATDSRATRDRLAHGAATHTDYDQSRARLAQARAGLSRARATLIQSSEAFRVVVGRAPEEVPVADAADLPPLGALIADLPEAPALKVAAARVAEARAGIAVARADRAPRLSLTAGLTGTSYRLDPLQLTSVRSPDEATAGITLTIPLFQGGDPGARVRQAEARTGAAIEARTAAERDMMAAIRSRYAELQAADAQVESLKLAVDANERARVGVEIGNRLGDRSLLDILNAQQEVLDAQTRLARARQDRLALAYAILGALGKLAPAPVAANPPAPASLRVAFRIDKAGLWQWEGSTTWSLTPGRKAA